MAIDTMKDAEVVAEGLKVGCFNESDILCEVIIGYPDNFHSDPDIIEVVNAKQSVNYADPALVPTAARLKVEFTRFKMVMESNGVVVHAPNPVQVPDQLTPRDIGFVIGDTFFVAGMKKKSRKDEKIGIDHLVKKMNKVVCVPDGIVVEGGDIVIDKGSVFVGISQRTDENGLNFIRQALRDTNFQVVGVPMKSLDDHEDCLHLDCVFVPVGYNMALIYPDGMKEIPDAVRNNYKWIVVNKEEQLELATNVLNLSPSKLVSREHPVCERVNKVLEQHGMEVIRLGFDEAPKTGGSFRCCTLPLIRKSTVMSR